ncbi:MAG: methanol/ethanol family PQQ-dependent dehydrogenase [Gemmatimonadota bacterium]|nr:methanol/ethanol family PQQ-dependent dehydrogenase [Gemmatimonadota bacterium]
MNRFAGLAASGLIALTVGFTLRPAALSGQLYRPVTDERLLSPEPENWLSYRGTYNGWGYSPLDQIDVSNVQDLVPVWTFSTGAGGGHESPPIVNDGIMFVTTPGNQVLALDVRTGDLLWRYRHELPLDRVAFHDTNRGVALFGDKVYTATLDARVVALDARSGEFVWDTSVADNAAGYYMTLAPLAARGKVMVGVSGGELGIRGFVVALDTETGEEVWRTHTIPGPGEPGNDTWPGDSWRTGGAAVWLTGHYDADLGLTYWGTGNPGPWIGDQRPGDNLYTNSVIALDVDTGELVAHHQYHWNGSWDWDEVSTPLLVDVEREGRSIAGLVHPGRNGYLWILERGPDAINFVEAQPFVQQNVFTSIDRQTGRPTYDEDRKPGTGKLADFCPSWWGGKDWPPAAYNPTTKLLYIPANENLCATSEGEEVEYRPGRAFIGADTEMTLRAGADHIGELQAWDLNAGEQVWATEFDSQNWGPVLTTGGGLVFMGGTNDRYFRAFNARTGEVLWQQRTNSGVIGVPSTYAVDGVQYVAVQSGWGVDAASMGRRIDGQRGTSTFVPEGGVVWVFALER